MKKLASVMISVGLFAGVMAKAHAQSAPIVVLEYPAYYGSGESAAGVNSDHPFIANPGHSATHRVGTDETLSHILTDYYGGSGLDMTFVQMAIVKANKHAFVRGNANFLYADKVLHLPSLTEMKNMVLGQNRKNSGQDSATDGNGRDGHIYFIGG